MQDARQITGVTVTFEVADGGAAITPDTWPWPENVPRADEIVEHDGVAYRVIAVRWSTGNPRVVTLRVRPA